MTRLPAGAKRTKIGGKDAILLPPGASPPPPTPSRLRSLFGRRHSDEETAYDLIQRQRGKAGAPEDVGRLYDRPHTPARSSLAPAVLERVDRQLDVYESLVDTGDGDVRSVAVQIVNTLLIARASTRATRVGNGPQPG